MGKRRCVEGRMGAFEISTNFESLYNLKRRIPNLVLFSMIPRHIFEKNEIKFLSPAAGRRH